MEIFSKQDHLFMDNTYALAEQVAGFGVYSSCFLLTASAILTMFFVLFAKDTLKCACGFPDILAWLIIAGAIYTGLILLMMAANYSVSRFKIFRRASTTDKARIVLTKVLSFFFFGLEFFVYQVKSIVLVLLLSSSHLQTKIEMKFSAATFKTLLGLAIVDFSMTVMLAYFKIQFLRQEVADGSYFARVPGKFETVYLVTSPLIVLCSLWSNEFAFTDLDNFDALFMTSQAAVSESYYIALLFTTLILMLVYLMELPYYHTLCERYMCHSLSMTLSVVAAVGISGYSYRLVAILLCLILPLQAVFVELFIDRVYANTFDLAEEAVSHTKIKVILAGNEEDRSRDTLKNLFIKRILGKDDKFEADEAMIMEKVMKEREGAIVGLLKKNCIETKEFESEQSRVESRENNKKSKTRNINRFDIKDDIYFQMISRYVEQSSYHQSACLIKLEWMLKKKFVILEILTLLNRILLNQETFRSKYICYYALRLTEKKLKFFYKMKESADSGYKDLNKVGLDLDTVLEYKKYMQRLIGSVEGFATLSKRVMQLIMTDGSSLRDIYTFEGQLFKMNRSIDQEFKVFHDNTLKTEYYHLVPYFYHLMYNANLYRSSKRVYQTFLSRHDDAMKHYADICEVKLDNLSVMLCSTTFLCDSDQSSLSLIKNVYGNKSDRYQSCIDKYPDVILPKVQNIVHYQAMRNYMKSDNTTQIKNINVGFTKMPNDHLIFKSTITIKVVPRLKQNFNFMVNLLESQNIDDYYIVVSQNMEIDSYSRNMAKIIERKYLVPGVPIGSVSKTAEKFIRDVLAQSRIGEKAGVGTGTMGEQGLGQGSDENEGQYKKSFTTMTALSNYEEQNFANKVIHEMAQKKLEFAEEMTFGATRKSQPKLFYARIVFNNFKYIAGGYFLLRMRDANSLKLGEVKKKIPRKVVRKNNDNFILNFSHSTSVVGDFKGRKVGQGFEESGYTDPNEDAQDYGVWNANDGPVGPFEVNPDTERLKTMKKGQLWEEPSEIKQKKTQDQPTPTSNQLSPKILVRPLGFTKNVKNSDVRLEKKLESLERSYDQHLRLGHKQQTGNLTMTEKEVESSIKKTIPSPKMNATGGRDYMTNSDSEENSVVVNASGETANVKKAIARVKEEKVMTRSSIMTVDASMGYKHNKIVYEDICTRKTAPSEIKLNRLHFVASLLFVTAFLVAILMFSFDLNSTFTSLNDFYLSYYNYKFSIQQITNKVLYQHGLDTGKIRDDRYEFLGYPAIANFTAYNRNSLKRCIEDFHGKFHNLLRVTVNSQESVSNVLFNKDISVSRNFLRQAVSVRDRQGQTGQPQTVTASFTVFEGLILESYSRVSRILWSMNTSTLLPFYIDTERNIVSKGLKFVGQYFLLYDSLNEHPLSKIEDILTNQLLRSQGATLIVLLVVLLCALALNFALACIQLLLVRNLTKKIFRVFVSFHLVSDLHFKKRLDQLESVYLLMRDIRESNYTINDSYRKENFETLTKKLKKDYPQHQGEKKADTHTSRMQKLIENANHADNIGRGRRMKYSKDSYFFNLFESYLAIALQAVSIIGYMILIYLQFSQKIGKKSLLFTKEQELNQLGHDAIVLHNYFLADYFFASPDLLLHKKLAVQGIRELYESVADTWFNKVDSIFGIDELGTESFVHSFRNTSSCQLVNKFKTNVTGSKTLCDLGQLKVMNQSLYIGLVSMYRQFIDLYKLTITGKSIAEKSFEFQEQRNLEWEFYMAELFYPTVDELISLIKQSFLTTYNNTDADSLQLVVLYTLAYIVLYSLCSTLAFNNLRRQIEVSRFAFQTFSMKAVLENNKVKARFVEFFGVNSREFI